MRLPQNCETLLVRWHSNSNRVGYEVKVLESRIETLEREIAELKSKLPTDT